MNNKLIWRDINNEQPNPYENVILCSIDKKIVVTGQMQILKAVAPDNRPSYRWEISHNILNNSNCKNVYLIEQFPFWAYPKDIISKINFPRIIKTKRKNKIISRSEIIDI